MRRTAVLGFLLLAFLAAPARPQDRRVLVPLEEFLPREATLYLTLPGGAAALRALDRAGEDEAALAERLSAFAEGKVKVAPLLAAWKSAASGPVSVCVVPERIPGKIEERAVLVAFGSTERSDRLLRAVGEAVRSLFAPAWYREVAEERIMSLPVHHFVGESRNLFLGETRGYVLVSTSGFLLGRVLREMQSPTGHTLKQDPDFLAAREGRDPGDGFVFARPAALPAGFEALGFEYASGAWADDGEGVRDEIAFVPAKEGLLADLVPGPTVPGAWAEAAGDLWIGANLAKGGATRLGVALLPFESAQAAVGLDAVSAGAAEALWRPGSAARIRLRLKAGAGDAAAPFGDRARIVGGDLVVAGAGEAPPDPPEGERDREFAGAAGVLRAPVAVLLAALGSPGAPGARRAAWRITVAEGRVVVSTGRLETGPVSTVLAAMVR